MTRLIFYDTETTGVRPDKDRVIEIAAYDATLNKTFCSFVNPQVPIPAESSAICNITDDMVADAPLFGEVAKQFLEFCHGDVILVAHNNDAFDKIFLQEEFKRSGLILPGFRYIDSLKWARKYRKDLPRHGLQYLREAYGINANQAHRALDDVLVLAQIFLAMIDDLSVTDIMERLAAPQEVSSMPFGKHRGTPLERLPKNYVEWLATSGALEKPDNLILKKALSIHFQELVQL
ncbi:MAG: DNA polymerase III subunit epsilon [Chlamydiae bacterium]|nr:DNA polymerase III subunit epsilon [Chlamydiota bacterium]